MKRLLILFFLLTANNLFGMQASALLPAMYNASYFIVPNYRFLYDAWIRVFQTHQFSQMQLPTVEDMRSVDFPEQTKAIIKKNVQKMGINKNLQLYSHSSESAGTAAYNLLAFNPKLINLHPQEEQEFICKHELTHIKNRDFEKSTLLSATLPIISFGALKLAQNALATFISKYAASGRFAKSLSMAPLLVNNIFTYYLLNLSIWSLNSKMQEYNADAGAIDSPDMGPAAIKAFMRMNKPDYKEVQNKCDEDESKNLWEKARNLYNYVDKWLHLQSHPSDWNRYLAINEKLKQEFGKEITGISKV